MSARSDALDVMRLLAHLFLAHGRPDQAITLLRAVRVLAPGDLRAAKLHALASIRCGKADQALQLLDQLLDGGDPSPVIHLLRGQALAGCGRAADAQRAFHDFTVTRRRIHAAAPGA
jgi:predicted Zn-dependent protease